MSDDDLLLDAADLADIFGADDAKTGEDFAKGIEDLFLSDDEDGGAGSGLGAALEAREAALAAAPPPPAPAPPAPPAPSVPAAVEEEPEPAEPDRGGMTEEEWRSSPQYADFKKQVIARHLRKKAAEEAARQAAELKAAQDAADAQARAKAEEEARVKAEEERRRQELLEKYKAAKAATIAQRAKAMVQAQDSAEAEGKASEEEKSAKLKGYLADLKAKMASGVPPMQLHAKAPAPKLSEAAVGLHLDLPNAKHLAAMFEETRTEMLRHIGDSIGKKPAQAMMKKTLGKVAKLHLDFYGRAAVDAKNELRADGALDEDRLARAIYAIPEEKRLAVCQKALFELIEIRFIACELGLGQSTKDRIVTRTMHALEASFAKKPYPTDLVKWYFDDVIPSTTMADSDV
jgi:hypothetical protein